MKGTEIRNSFLKYFEKNGHKIVHSSPLLPANDPTLLFTNAGMNQFKDVFTGAEKRDYTRAVSSQKCIRAGGKHNDLDEVGKTARHHTFFEMLGNFSFGDYFKQDAIRFAWDFLVNELKLDPQRLWFSVFEGDSEVPADDEARELWIKAGAPPERVLGFGRKDNFWQMGDTGPCGPCSEIHYYMGDSPGDPERNHAKWVNGEGDTTMEIWNLVFMQFERNEVEKGVFELTPLPAPSVDTGAGLERLSAVLQGVSTNYDTDLIKPIIDFAADLAGVEYSYDTPKGFALRVLADHARATAFAIADGILPGNEGRNYVLRKIMRRAIYHGREHLGFETLFFNQVCNFVVGLMGEAYPELITQRDFIGKMVRLEEERFGATLTVGLERLNTVMPNLERALKPNFEKIAEVLKKNEKIAQNLANALPTNEVVAKAIAPIAENIARIGKDYERIAIQGLQAITSFKFNLDRIMKPAMEALAQLANSEEFKIAKRDYEAIENIIRDLDRTSDDSIALMFREFAKLYDTFGTPRDLIRVSLEEHGIAFEESEFEDKFSAAIEDLQKTSDIGKTKQAEKINPIYGALEESGVKSIFRGYETTEIENAKVIALIRDDLRVDSLNEGDEGLIILDKTPFYAESGGQVGDTGMISKQLAVSSEQNERTAHGSPLTAHVIDTFSPIAGIILHKSKVESGSIKVGDVVTASVDVEKRDATRRNHTATHLVHAALKEVLGSHVKQAGSVVAPSFLRFDFTHYQPITDSELQEIENLVNRYILKNEPVNTDVMAIEDAMRTGAVALFGEKYGSAVRVLSVGGGEFSRELCGGTHVRATGDIGSFKIVSDEAIASGVRRIRAITGFDSFNRFREDERLIDRSLQALKTQRDQLPSAIERLQEELKRTRKEIDELKMKIATGAIGGASDGDEARDVNGVKVVAKIVEGLDKGGMRHLSDTLLAKLKSGVVILARTEEEKVGFIVRVSDDLTGKIKAGAIVQQIAPIVGGRGGGKPDMAEGGGTEPGKLQDAIDASYGVIESMS